MNGRIFFIGNETETIRMAISSHSTKVFSQHPFCIIHDCRHNLILVINVMNYEELIQSLDRELRVADNFDIIKRDLLVQNKKLSFYCVDGFVKDEVLEKMMEFMLKADLKSMSDADDFQSLTQQLISYVEVEMEPDVASMVTAVLSGTILLVIEGYGKGILIDARTYPTRGMEEPEDDRVLRGSRDGFVETLVFNTALIRRRIRDHRLRMEYTNVGMSSKTDLVLCYMENKVDQKMLERIRGIIADIQVEALTMAQESLAEALIPGKWYTPFPKVRYTERPDTAASNILEGKIILIIDNSPSVLILPTYFFDFVQEAQDYYLPPITGTYLRCIRIAVFFATLLITPIWYYLNCNPSLAPSWLQFAIIPDNGNLPFIAQLLLLEFGIDALKLASLNTPSSLNNSFSIIGALILGDYAVNAGWFNPEIILYMAFVALANFTQPSYELGYGVKFMRVMLLILTAFMPRYGFWIGIVLMIILLYNAKTVSKQSYLYPLIPFNWSDFKMIFTRKKLRDKS